MSSHPVTPARLSDERILRIVADRIAALGGTWTVQPGPILRSQGSVAIRVGTPHDDSHRHIDLEILLSVDHPEETSLVDCSSGFADDPQTAVEQAVDAWIETTAGAALETAQQQGRLAAHRSPDSPDGFPGWHMIMGNVTGFGFDDDVAVKQQWIADTAPWRALAPVISTGLDRPYLNGVRIFVGQGGDSTFCDVVINGHRHQEASDALAAMDWPRTARMSYARTYLILVHPAENP